MGRVIMSGIVLLLTKPGVKANFADNDWATIIDVCHANRVPNTWVVGNSKTMLINGAEYQIDIIGKNHDDYAYGSGKAPLTFQLHDCYGELKAMNNAYPSDVGWTNCDMRQTYLPTIFTNMPSEVQSGIREVKKLTAVNNQSDVINVTTDNLFLLSEIEIFGSAKFSGVGEGTQYAYYRAGNSKVKNRNGFAVSWWERSPVFNKSQRGQFCLASENGAASYTVPYYDNGVSFAFCF